MLWKRLATAAVAIPFLWLFVEKAPAEWFGWFIVIVTALGLYEYFAMAMPDHLAERIAGMAFGLVVAAGVAARDPALWGAGVSVTVIAGFVFLLARRADLTAAVGRLGVVVLGVLYLGFFTPHIILLRELHDGDGKGWVLFTVGAVFGSDTGGYFAGRAYGRRKLMPDVSPKKTVEGAAGAVAGAVAAALLMHVLVHPSLELGEVVGVAVAMSVLAQFGDLCESALKRAFGAKDSGWILPGHGGILDRLDSLLFPFVFAYYYAAVLGR
jgi:phosphatidate cytidylyltransferase